MCRKSYYRGYNIKDLVQGFLKDKHYGFEEIAYLLLFGELPDKTQLQTFHETLVERRTLPPTFVRDVIMKAPSRDMMNSLSRSILSLYTYDPHCKRYVDSKCTASEPESDQSVPDADDLWLSCI